MVLMLLVYGRVAVCTRVNSSRLRHGIGILMSVLPTSVESVEELDELLTLPSAGLAASIAALQSPLVIVGAGGKMGPSLAVLAKRAAVAAGKELRVDAASRFSNADKRDWLEQRGVETAAVDVFDRQAVEALPDSDNVIYLVGLKFGTSVDSVQTWATNTVAPSIFAERYCSSKVVALSTGNVYPFTTLESGGSVEGDALTPLGEYANAAVARERVLEYFSRKNQMPLSLVRLNYAHDLRYGVLTDIAKRIWQGEPVDLTMGYFNAIWQGDANSLILRCLEQSSTPARAVNITGTEILSVRATAQRMGEALGRPVVYSGEEAATALLSSTGLMSSLLGEPSVSTERLIDWVVGWTKKQLPTLGKPTGFDVRDGKY